MSVRDQPRVELTHRTIGLMFAAVVSAVLFAMALAHLFTFAAEIGGQNRPSLGARCDTNPIVRLLGGP